MTLFANRRRPDHTDAHPRHGLTWEWHDDQGQIHADGDPARIRLRLYQSIVPVIELDWFWHGDLHRTGNQPARIEWVQGEKQYYIWCHEGEYHRSHGPAQIVYERDPPHWDEVDMPWADAWCCLKESWYQHDQPHRVIGPAHIHHEGVESTDTLPPSFVKVIYSVESCPTLWEGWDQGWTFYEHLSEHPEHRTLSSKERDVLVRHLLTGGLPRQWRADVETGETFDRQSVWTSLGVYHQIPAVMEEAYRTFGSLFEASEWKWVHLEQLTSIDL